MANLHFTSGRTDALKPKQTTQRFWVDLDDRRPGATAIAQRLQQQHPAWSWAQCCAKAKAEWVSATPQLTGPTQRDDHRHDQHRTD